MRYLNSVFDIDPSDILVASIPADALILALAILVIELPVPSWSIVLFVNVVVLDAVTVE